MDQSDNNQSNQTPPVPPVGDAQVAPAQPSEPVVPQPTPEPTQPETPVPAADAASDAQLAETPAPEAAQVSDATTAEGGDYMKNVGQSMVDLLTDISTSDVMKQRIATEARISVEKVTELCNGVLEKYDTGKITEEELAFLIAAPVADAAPDQGSSA